MNHLKLLIIIYTSNSLNVIHSVKIPFFPMLLIDVIYIFKFLAFFRQPIQINNAIFDLNFKQIMKATISYIMNQHFNTTFSSLAEIIDNSSSINLYILTSSLGKNIYNFCTLSFTIMQMRRHQYSQTAVFIAKIWQVKKINIILAKKEQTTILVRIFKTSKIPPETSFYRKICTELILKSTTPSKYRCQKLFPGAFASISLAFSQQIIILKDQLEGAMKWILGLNQPIKNLKEYASICSEELARNAAGDGQKRILPYTKQDQLREDREGHFEISQSKPARGWQSSFQKYFLAQHTATLKKQLQNLLEFTLTFPLQQNQKALSSHRFQQSQAAEHSPLSLLLARAQIPTSPLHLHQFSQGKGDITDLWDFLEEALVLCGQALGAELVAVAVELWIQFRNLDFKFLDRKELLQIANEWVAEHGQRTCQRKDLPRLNMKPSTKSHLQGQIEKSKKLIRFLRYFSATVIFILAGFFQNPYTGVGPDKEAEFKVDYPKRQLIFSTHDFQSNDSDFSDSEASFHPKKLIKEQ